RAVRETAVLDEGATALAPLGSAVRELLRAGLGRDPAVASGLLRAADLAARTKAIVVVAERYRELLAESRLVDPAEALWRAAPQDAPLGTTSLPVLVAGYPRVGLAELVFLDSVAGDGSVFVL